MNEKRRCGATEENTEMHDPSGTAEKLVRAMLFSCEGGEKLCERAGVSAEEYRAAAVSGILDGLGAEARRLAAAEAPLVWRALLDAAEGGNMTAIKLYFDIFGRGASENDVGEGAVREDGEVAALRSELFYGGESEVSPADVREEE